MKSKIAVLALASSFISYAVQAEINLSGFASITGGITTSSDEALYGFNDTFDFKNGSLLAIQASSNIGEGLDITAQIVSRGENDWDTKFEWAYVSYNVNDKLRLLAGRQRAPFYMYSDFLDVSYAYPWITPPQGVYDLIFNTFDGLSGIYSTTLGEFDSTYHFIVGNNSDEIEAFGETTKPSMDNLMGGAATFTRDWLTLRAAYFSADVSIPLMSLDTLAGNWNAVGYQAYGDNTRIFEDKGTFWELGFQMDFDGVMVIGEYTSLEIDNTLLGDEESYYLMFSKRFDNYLIHITYGVDETSINDFTRGLPTGTPLDALKLPTQGIIASRKAEQSYVTVGLRWDFHNSASLKFEYTDFSDDINSSNDAGLFRTSLVTIF
ncbi:porin [Colwellia hornerae]|uniref:Porin n=1 Tax=Colwellia hornerae TaxID=89402 RepID=A0A5C6QU66_9GAMM|nr:porin [Colwellia hornerae]TWX56914.1 porin [Colwellia hornerae]TWX62361.1 porin [Colwellia hornerae]TWX72307.1 porin [Colwellia hornerae]